jgi:hypothetical protein
MYDFSLDETEHVSLCEALDRILNKGAVVVGEVTISVANIDLIYLGLQLVLTSIETARETMPPNQCNSSALKVGARGGGYVSQSCGTA